MRSFCMPVHMGDLSLYFHLKHFYRVWAEFYSRGTLGRMQSPACNRHPSTWWPGLTVLNLAFRSEFSLSLSWFLMCIHAYMYSLPVLLWIDLLLFCIIHNCQWIFFLPWSYIYMCVCVCISVCNCFKDRLPDRHLCLNLYPCVIKVESVNQSVNLCSTQWVWLPLLLLMCTAWSVRPHWQIRQCYNHVKWVTLNYSVCHCSAQLLYRVFMSQ